MGNTSATIMGAFVCCIVPLLSFGAGIYYARYGIPLSVNWRGFGRARDEEEGEGE